MLTAICALPNTLWHTIASNISRSIIIYNSAWVTQHLPHTNKDGPVSVGLVLAAMAILTLAGNQSMCYSVCVITSYRLKYLNIHVLNTQLHVTNCSASICYHLSNAYKMCYIVCACLLQYHNIQWFQPIAMRLLSVTTYQLCIKFCAVKSSLLFNILFTVAFCKWLLSKIKWDFVFIKL